MDRAADVYKKEVDGTAVATTVVLKLKAGLSVIKWLIIGFWSGGVEG